MVEGTQEFPVTRMGMSASESVYHITAGLADINKIYFQNN